MNRGGANTIKQEVEIEVDRDVTGFPGETAATLIGWPALFTHPELDDTFSYITTLVEGRAKQYARSGSGCASAYRLFCPSKESASTKFERLATCWRTGTRFVSDETELLMHPAYLEIIGMGPFALPLIFEEMSVRGGAWYAALKLITGHDPVPEEHQGVVSEMKTCWLRWGRKHGYITGENCTAV
jgi:hypothetical protein